MSLTEMNTPASSVISQRRAQQGIGLIEIMIALLVLSIGLLGMASMQTNGLQMTGESLARSQAVVLGNDLIERVRTNRDNRDDYVIVEGNVPDCATDYTPDFVNNTLAENDVAEWLNALACLLPNADASVAVTPDETLVVSIEWASRSGLDEDGQLVLRSRI